MLTTASEQALAILRDPTQLQWYVIPLLAIAIYIYAVEIERENWDLVFAGLAFWGMDWINEIINSLILHFTQHSGLWTAPGKTAYLILSGLNFEICFMFCIAGVALSKMLPKNRKLRILGIPNRLFFGLVNSIFCVGVEVLLNLADMLIWEYPFWSVPHVWLIVPFGYLHFNLVAFWVHDMPTVRQKVRVVSAIYGIVVAAALVFGVGLGWI
ncbi:MAG: hypothetical protein JRI68_27535 [Deltaproteobacteria bacterium]|nr:hypothetical protein [Deltaproteobacteria bacterium]